MRSSLFIKIKISLCFPKKSICSRPPENSQGLHHFKVGVGSFLSDYSGQGYIKIQLLSYFKGRVVLTFINY
jgi:hypothetical protein